jgi:thioredoxin
MVPTRESASHGLDFAKVPFVAGQVIRCPNCGQANRLPELGSGKKAVCGRCKAPLNEAAGPIVLTDATFDEGVRSGAYVVDFWAAWCGPCRTIAPVIDALAAERTDVRFAKLNVDENPRTAARFEVQGIPLLVFLKNGAEAGRVTGAVPRGQIEAAIQRYLGG